MRALLLLAPFSFAFSFACGHGEAALREEQASSRHYRDAYESQAQQIAQLKARIAEMEKRGCRSP
ncbi:MAG: hypothetical protein E6J78_18065 [Deltaproteobacteria bacterium]|nr:MAG: hypothetical protein E6J78_18065 [Deltaproteobacteria bacterium]